MSKKTRKKSPGAAPAKASRTGLKRPTKKSVRTTSRTSAAKASKTTAKTPIKTPTKTPKTAAKKSNKAVAKAPPKIPQRSATAQPRTARARKPTPEATVKSRGTAAVPATKAPVATVRASALPAEPTRPTVAIEGGLAPDFHLPRDGGEHVSLPDYVGSKLVIFFYPRADTPGCTREAIDFTRLKDDFAATGTAVLGVSADSIKAQESFRNKHQLSIPLISDETHEMLQAYAAWGEKSMYGRSFLGVLRTTVLIDSNGRIARIWHGVKVDGHADAVLAAAREL
jgi:thioredoxin-dependent peroxiredoxin